MAKSKVVKKKATKRAPAFVMRSHTNYRITLPRAPRVTDFSNIGQEWSESARAGKEPVMRRTGKKLRTFGIEIELGHRNPFSAVRSDLQKLESFAQTTKPVKISYTNLETGYFYITDFSYTVTARRPSDNEASRATVSITFAKAVTDTIKVGALKKPKKAKKKPKAKPKPKPKKKKTRTYKMKKGDTLWTIARRYYGNSNKWKKLADANKIKNPRRIPIGKVIKIP